MRYLLTAGQMRDAEAAAVAGGATLVGLMDRAGAAVAAEVASLSAAGRVVVLAGGGNNGGDGWVAARLLHEAGRDVLVLSAVDPRTLPAPANEAAATASSSGVPWKRADAAMVSEAGREASVVVDALLGIGAHGAPRPPYDVLIGAAAEVRCPVVAVDVPSGVDADTGATPGPSIRADVTVTFAAPKLGCVLQPGASRSGELVVVDIGIAASATTGVPEIWDADDYARRLPRLSWDDTKATRGRVLIVGGAPGMTGAACLAAMGALRTGAGYVTVAVPAPSLAIVEAKLTAPVKLALPAGPDGSLEPGAVEAILQAASRADAVLIGPGLGRSGATIEVVREVVSRLDVPLVVDADALFALGEDLGQVAERTAPTILTPHAGEAARLLGSSSDRVQADRLAAARALAVGSAVAVLKGPATLVAGEDRVVVNPSGGPGLATLGTGDVLAGMVAGLVAAGLSPLDAAVVGTYLHGMSGDMASRDLTPLCCTAEDVVAYLPEAVRSVTGAALRTCDGGTSDE